MKSNWKVSSNYWGEKKVYQVFRTLDVEEVDHSGNREYVPDGVFDTRAAAQICADELNKIEGGKTDVR
jgi:hypothetical protein